MSAFNPSVDTFPQTFTGFGKNGTAGDPLLNDNYNWTMVASFATALEA